MTAAERFVDTQRPITPAEIAGWKFFLKMPRDSHKGAWIVLRRVHVGMHQPRRCLASSPTQASPTRRCWPSWSRC